MSIHKLLFTKVLVCKSYHVDLLIVAHILLGLLWRGKSGGFGLSPPYFSRSIIFPAIIKPTDSAFWVSGGMGHATLHVAFIMFNKHIFNYIFEQYMPNYTNCLTKGSIFEKK